MKKILLLVLTSLLFASCNNNNNKVYKIATTTGDFSGFEGYETDKARIKAIHDAGFKYIDLSLYSLTKDHDYFKDDWKEKILDLKAYADDLGVEFVQAHSQGGNSNSDNQAEVDFIVESTLKSLEICWILGIKSTVVHAGVNAKYSKEEWLEANKKFYDRLLPTAEKYGVNILCENTTSKNIGGAYGLTDADKVLELINYVNHPNFHACWDFGHANCEPDQVKNIRKLGKEIYAVHIHDNLGDRDSHLMPYCGNLDFKSTLKALNDINFNGYYAFECDADNRNISTYKGKDYSEQLGLKKGAKIEALSRTEQEKWLYLTAVDMLGGMVQ